MAIPKKPRTCRVCKTVFQPVRCLQTVCSPECAIEQAKAKRAKDNRLQAAVERKAIKLRKEAIKTRREWIQDAQTAFNAFIRERDKDKPCICCGQPLESGNIGGSFDCGHYRSVGSAPHLRFDERNAHGQRKQCNRYGAGRAVDYRIGLVARIGIGAVDALESDNEPRKWTIEQLKEIRDKYRGKIKDIRGAN